MSVQLIIYPQSYLGVVDPISGSSQEFVVDGIDFDTMNATSSYTSSTFYIPDLLLAAPPAIVNTWYRWRYPDPTANAFPTQSGNNVVLEGNVGARLGMYQKLTNLIIGQSYTYTVETAVPSVTSGEGTAAIFDVNGGVYFTIGATVNTITGADITGSFTATATSLIFIFAYRNTTGTETDDTITNISIKESTPTGTDGYLGNGQEICDLYEDEDIPLTLSIDDFKNVAEQVQSYSKAFRLPGTKHNNKIFNALYEITRTAQNTIEFNPYVKTKCVLKQDGLLLFEGYLKMIDIQEKGGEISYNINLYSEVVALVDVLGDRTFSDLDFTELAHDYNKTEIKNSWNDLGGGSGITYNNASTSGFRTSHNTVKYPFVDWTHQWVLGGTGGSPDATANMPELTSLEQAFRPFINVKYCIERIFDATPFSFTSIFFDTGEFEDLFMDFNWGSDNTPVEIGVTFTTAAFYSPCGTNSASTSYAPLILSDCVLFGSQVSFFPANYNTTTNIITSTVINESYNITYLYSIKNYDSVTRTVECQWLYTEGGVAQPPVDYSGVITLLAGESYGYSGTLTQVMSTVGDTLQAQFRCDAGTAAMVRQGESLAAPTAIVEFGVGALAITTNTMLQTLRGELGQWDFLKGIMTMFNLVSIPDKSDPNNIFIEPWVDVFGKTGAASGLSLAEREIQLDWTNKIDVSEMKLTPLTDLNKKTIFKFVEDDDDWAASYYKTQAGGWLYGEERMDSASFAGNGLPTLLEGEDEIIAEPFASTVIKALDPQFNELVVPSIYSYNPDDGTSEGFDNSPRIMYNNRKKTLVGSSYYIPEQNGVTWSNEEEFLQFSHLTTVPSGAGVRDFLFASKQLFPGVGSPSVDNLVNVYWLPYLAELYNPDTRTMTIKVNLNAGDISTFDFSYTVYVKNREFRVNKIDYKPNDLATVEFILIP